MTGKIDPAPRPASWNLFRGAARIGRADDVLSCPVAASALQNAESKAWLLERSVMYFTKTAGRAANDAARPYVVFDVDGGRIAAFVSGRVSADAVAALSALGFGAACRAPAETLACAYVQWGEQFVDRLGDDCVGVIWDDRRSRLLLTRGLGSDTTLYVGRRHCHVEYWAGAGGVPTPRAAGHCPSEPVTTGTARSFDAVEPGALLILE